MVERETDTDEAFLRQVVLPEEDRCGCILRFWWTGGFRWFRSSNVIPIERWRTTNRAMMLTQAETELYFSPAAARILSTAGPGKHLVPRPSRPGGSSRTVALILLFKRRGALTA